MSTLRAAVIAASLIVIAPAAASAADLALDFTGGAFYRRLSFQNFGWSFTLAEDRRVTALGLFDFAANGLADEHDVGLWDDAGNLLVQAKVSSADPLTTSASAAGDWRFQTITPLFLAAGTYVIGAHYPTFEDNGAYFAAAASITTDPVVTFGAGLATTGDVNGFARPTSPVGAQFYPGFFGPNLTLAPVPEPATWALMILGFGLTGGSLRRRDTAAASAPSP